MKNIYISKQTKLVLYCIVLYLVKFCVLTYVNFLHFLDNDDRMSSKRRNLSALVFLIKL